MSDQTACLIVVADDGLLIFTQEPQGSPRACPDSWPGGLTDGPDGTVSREAEAAYRRGFTHGAYQAINGFETWPHDIAIANHLRKWLHNDVWDWRRNRGDLRGNDRAVVTCPPEIPGRPDAVTPRTRRDVAEYAIADQSQVENATL